MKRYVIRRLLLAIPLLLAISFVCFVFINLIPSNPAEVALRVQQMPVITEEAIMEMEEMLGLNKPFLIRYLDWVLGCLQGNFGISYVNPARTVAGELARCLPATLQLAAASFVIVVILSIPIGFLCAVYKDGWFDKVMRGLVFISTAMPAYWVGLLLMWGVSVKLGLLPTNGSGSWKHLVMPAFTVALSYISTYIRLIRNNMLENMKQDYVLYANVRGLPQKSILVKHILKNSMHTCIVAMGMSIPQLISGTIVVENVFSWPGLGTLCISSIFNRDLPVIQTYVLLIGVLFVVFNLVFDVLQTVGRNEILGNRFLHNRTAVMTVTFVLLIGLTGILAPVLAPHDPYATDILNKFAAYSLEYPLGTDHLGRCVLSRLIYGIRPTLGLALLTMLGTIALGAILGVMAGYFRGVVEEIIMRVVDVMLSFPSQIMVFAVVGLLGINVQNVIIANVFIKWAWYARMIRTGVMQYRDRNFIQFSRCVGMPERFILLRHLLPSITSDLAVLASLDVGWAIINISTLSFLGLGVQAPTPEWGAMLNEAKEVLTSNPIQMIAPGVAIVVLVCCFNLMGDALRDVLDPKEVEK